MYIITSNIYPYPHYVYSLKQCMINYLVLSTIYLLFTTIYHLLFGRRGGRTHYNIDYLLLPFNICGKEMGGGTDKPWVDLCSPSLD